MRESVRKALDVSLVGFLAGTLLFFLEATLRLVHLYSGTNEQAPSGYITFALIYGITGTGIALAVWLLAILERRIRAVPQLVIRVGIYLAPLVVMGIVVFVVARKVAALHLPGPEIRGYLFTAGTFGAAAVVLAVVFVSLWQRLGIGRLVRLFLVVAAIAVVADVALLHAMGWERVIRKVEPPTAAASKPNVLLLTVDTLRADRIGAYGYSKSITPNIDRLAAGGVLFERAIAQSSWTRSSFGSVMTSLYPSEHGAFVVDQPMNRGESAWNDRPYDSGLRDDVITAAQIFRHAGYATLAIQTNWQASSAQGFDRGFDSFVFEGLFPIHLSGREHTGHLRRTAPGVPGTGCRAGSIAFSRSRRTPRPPTMPWTIWRQTDCRSLSSCGST